MVDHYRTIRVEGSLQVTERIVLVDDVITTGAVALGCARRLEEVYPEAEIVVFAAMRRVDLSEFKEILDPQVGTVKLREDGLTTRRP